MPGLIYHDDLISKTADTIIFEHYYYPSGKVKTVQLADIEWIKVKIATIRNGKWRIHGTGNFKTWFPKGKKRPSRDTMFFAKLRRRWDTIGFTVEDSAKVIKIFKEKNMIRAE